MQEKFVKLPKDAGSGSKFYHGLTGSSYKKHGFQIESKEVIQLELEANLF